MNQNLIVLEPAANIRARGRAALNGNWQQAIMAILLYSVFISLIPSLIDSLLGWSYTGPSGVQIANSPSWLYLLLVSGPFSLGLVTYFIGLFRHQETDTKTVFNGFDHFGKALFSAWLWVYSYFYGHFCLLSPALSLQSVTVRRF